MFDDLVVGEGQRCDVQTHHLGDHHAKVSQLGQKKPTITFVFITDSLFLQGAHRISTDINYDMRSSKSLIPPHLSLPLGELGQGLSESGKVLLVLPGRHLPALEV